ncbi:MAG: hypothetical protein N2545_00745 [Thermoflexales bacterium]|nr:hypothetical protein [Thermoflexales bacterium]
MSELNDMCREDAASIVNTYNYDLAAAIKAIGDQTPRANRNTYVKRLMDWDAKRSAWKLPQIALYTENSARAKAQQDFYRFNAVFGVAMLLPKQAQCPVCQGWIKRGEVSLREAEAHPPPYHVNCPHYWHTKPERVPRHECPMLWMGT